MSDEPSQPYLQGETAKDSLAIHSVALDQGLHCLSPEQARVKMASNVSVGEPSKRERYGEKLVGGMFRGLEGVSLENGTFQPGQEEFRSLGGSLAGSTLAMFASKHQTNKLFEAPTPDQRRVVQSMGNV